MSNTSKYINVNNEVRVECSGSGVEIFMREINYTFIKFKENHDFKSFLYMNDNNDYLILEVTRKDLSYEYKLTWNSDNHSISEKWRKTYEDERAREFKPTQLPPHGQDYDGAIFGPALVALPHLSVRYDCTLANLPRNYIVALEGDTIILKKDDEILFSTTLSLL